MKNPNQTQFEEMCHKVDGYFFHAQPGKYSDKEMFYKARDTVVKCMERDVQWLKTLTPDQFLKFTGRKEVD